MLYGMKIKRCKNNLQKAFWNRFLSVGGQNPRSFLPKTLTTFCDHPLIASVYKPRKYAIFDFGRRPIFLKEKPPETLISRGFRGMRHGGFEPLMYHAIPLYLQGFADSADRFVDHILYPIKPWVLNDRFGIECIICHI